MEKINFVDLPSTTTPLSAENLNAIQNNVENAIEETLNIELIAVSDTAPSECSIGDKYYNTTDKKIYTATAMNTWSETGTTPISGILYIVYNEQASYSWDGTDLVSVGGGKEDIVIDDEEPTDPDVKLWIDTGEVQNLGSEVHIGDTIDSKVGLNILYSKNLFDENSVVNNLRLGTNGAVLTDQYSSTLFTTNFIEILPSTQYTTSFTPSSDYTTRKCFYDSSKTFISYSDSDKTFTTPNNAKYMRFTYSIDNINNVMLVKGSSVPTTYQPYITPTINVDGEDIYNKDTIYEIKDRLKITQKAYNFTSEKTIRITLDNYKTFQMFGIWGGTQFAGYFTFATSSVKNNLLYGTPSISFTNPSNRIIQITTPTSTDVNIILSDDMVLEEITS